MAKGRAPKGRGRGKTVKDYQRGKAADDYEVDVEGEAGEGHNSKHFEPNGKTLAEFKQVVTDEKAEIKAIMDAARLKCQGPRAAIAKAKKRMVKDGYHAKELDTLMRKWGLEAKLDHVADNLDDEQIEHYRNCEKALGDFASTPLGDAAVQAAEAALQPAE